MSNKYRYDHSKQKLVEIDNGPAIRSIESIKQYPCFFLTKERNGDTLIYGVDFKHGLIGASWCSTCNDYADLKCLDTHIESIANERIIAIPLDAATGTDEGERVEDFLNRILELIGKYDRNHGETFCGNHVRNEINEYLQSTKEDKTDLGVYENYKKATTIEDKGLTKEEILEKHYEANYQGRNIPPKYQGKYNKNTEEIWVLPAMEEYANQFRVVPANTKSAEKILDEHIEGLIGKNSFKEVIKPLYDSIHAAMEQYASQFRSATPPEVKSDAVEFAEWVATFENIPQAKKHHGVNSIQDLYQLFKAKGQDGG